MDGALPLAPAIKPARLRLLGGEVDVVTPQDVLDFTARRIAERRPGVVANHNLHSLYLLRRAPEMARFYERADLIEADSTPLIAWGRLLGRPIGRQHRCTYLDWREAFWARAAAQRWRVFYLGGEPGVAERGAEAVRRRWPGLRIAVRHGRFDMDGAENATVLDEIKAFAPDVLFVGMGMPRQEAWILANLDRLDPCVAFSVGAAFDYEAGAAATPPRWAGRLGVEWLFRLAAEPRRLAGRYLIEPWSLIGPAAADLAAALRR
jgi:N-acetylglucosaminyldiphosphoundecaprenol N-acetyl-beta-D-mannosaminyltransferase